MHTCFFCKAIVPDVGTAIADGWLPSFWCGEDDEYLLPICGACVRDKTDELDGETVLKAEFRPLLDVSAPEGNR